MASIEEFHNIEMRVGTIIAAEVVLGADKLLKLTVDFGVKPLPETLLEEISQTSEMDRPVLEPERDIRQIVSGIRQYYSPDDIVGKQCPFVTNLAPRMIRGLESNGMILAVKTEDGGAVLLHPNREVNPGNKLS